MLSLYLCDLFLKSKIASSERFLLRGFADVSKCQHQRLTSDTPRLHAGVTTRTSLRSLEDKAGNCDCADSPGELSGVGVMVDML